MTTYDQEQDWADCGEALKELSRRYGIESIQYDERLPVPPELLEGMDPDLLARALVFPVIKDGDRIVVAVADPENVDMEVVRKVVRGAPYELRVAPESHIRWMIDDYLNAPPGEIIGTERTGLAYWRNTMATWRTRLACYRTDLAKIRVSLSVLRWGLGFVTLASASAVLGWSFTFTQLVYWVLLVSGIAITGVGLYLYLKLRRLMMRSPGPQTLVEVTGAALRFVEDYQVDYAPRPRTKATMLSRLTDFLPSYCSLLRPEPESRERTHLARERDILAAQRTLAACYRTLYARARTGLAFIRTGIVFLGIGLGLVRYFQVDMVSLWGLILILAGGTMIIDGLQWYLPTRKEEPKLERLLSDPVR
ncbi:hypothetical protein BMS3Abin01_00810 [bacterium BMS3Abin01]|nr:hypothetical protein BMS3Abin01_00810 [bacterium BMS3Abin01]